MLKHPRQIITSNPEILNTVDTAKIYYMTWNFPVVLTRHNWYTSHLFCNFSGEMLNRENDEIPVKESKQPGACGASSSYFTDLVRVLQQLDKTNSSSIMA